MIKVIEALKEGEKAVPAPSSGMRIAELQVLLLANNLRVTGRKQNSADRLIAAVVQDTREQ